MKNRFSMNATVTYLFGVPCIAIPTAFFLLVLGLSGCPAQRAEPTTLEWWYPGRDVETLRYLEEKKVSFGFSVVPLSEVLQKVQEMAGVVLRKDQNMLSDPPVTLRVDDLELFIALRWISGVTKTAWGKKDGEIYFSDTADGFDFVGADYTQ